MITISSRTYYDVDFVGDPGGGVPYLNALPVDRIKVVTEGYISWGALNKRVIFDAATKTITKANDLDFTSFIIDAELKVGDTIEIEGTALNDGSLTVAAVEDDVITTVEALVDETAEDCSIYGTTEVAALDMYSNIIENSAQESYFSLVDSKSLTRFVVNNTDFTGVAGAQYFSVGTPSRGWVTDKITTGGVCTETYFLGLGLSADHKQQFRVVQIFDMPPWFTRDQYLNFIDRDAPDYFQSGRKLKHVLKFDAKFFIDDPTVVHTGSVADEEGITAWFDQNIAGTPVDYTVESVAYEDDATGDPLDKIDIAKKVNITIVVNSASGQFNGSTKFVVGFMRCPLDEADYVTTETEMYKNFFRDRKQIQLGVPPVNGDNFGTDYQVLTGIVGTVDSANQATIELSYEPDQSIIDALIGEAEEDRNYLIWVTTQDEDIVTTRQIDRVAMIADFQLAAYDQDNDTLIELEDYLRCYRYPDEVDNPFNSIVGYEGDPFYVRIPFFVETAVVDGVNPTINALGIQVVAVKTDREDFELEGRVVDASQVRKLLDVQTIDVEEDRGFISYDGDPRNRFRIVRQPGKDTGTLAAYELQYGLTLRYEWWLPVVPVSEGAGVDIFADIENVTHQWSNYNNVNGWTLKLRFTADIAGYDGHVSEFYAETDITVHARTDVSPVGSPGVIRYFTDEDVQVNGVVLHWTSPEVKKTRIQVTYEGDFSGATDGFAGTIFADLIGSSGIFDRRFASTEIPSEASSPFEATDADTAADESYADGGVRINIYGTNRVVLETLFNPAEYRADNVIVFSRLYYKGQQCAILEEGDYDVPVLDETGEPVLDETCIVT